MAEEYVLLFEKNRLNSLGVFSEIKRVSDYDVAAGYDIASYENADSKRYDRFIEVKAVDSKMGFHWSKNEISVAEREGEHYFLYLVDLQRYHQEDYEPCIICNPHDVLQSENEWMIESESFYIHKMID